MSVETLGLGPDDDGRVLDISGDGRVARFGSPDAAPSTPGSRQDCRKTRLRPGDVNAHTHLYGGLSCFGMPAPRKKPQNFLQILERIWWRLDRALDPGSLRAAARYYAASALLSGTTTLIDHHESPGFIEGSLDVIADVCQSLGIRAVLCYGATERNHGREEAERGLAECRRFIRENKRPLVTGVVGLHACFTVSDETVREAGDLCRELDTVLHVHVAEDPADVRDARDRGYLGPLERLRELDALPRGSLLAHGVHLDRDQVRKATKWGAWFIQNPRSNLGNDVGYPRTLGESTHVALGTDGYPSNMHEEQAILLREGLKHGEKTPGLTARLQAGRRLAAERFGLALDRLAPGTIADAVALGANGARHVVVNGRQVVRDGRLLNADQEAIAAEARAEAARLWERMEAL